MGFAKTLLAGAALAINATALDVQFDPDLTLVNAYLGADSGAQDATTLPGTGSGSLLLQNHGVSIDSALEVERRESLTRVSMAATITLAPEGNGGTVSYSGEFTLDQPAYVQFFGQLGGNSPNPDAVSYLYATTAPIDLSELLYEFEYQYGQVPESVAIDGQVGVNGGMDGNLAAARLVPAGRYSFFVEISGYDFALTADTGFSTSGNVGFVIFTEAEAPPVPPEDAPTIQDLVALVDVAEAAGEITPGIANALRSKLAYAGSGRGNRACPQLKAFLHHVSAQSGNHISAPAAEALTLLTTEVLKALETVE